jgi:hypothetical protein
VRSTCILLAAAILAGCDGQSDCTPDTERCLEHVPQYCFQSPYASEGVGVWVGGTSCEEAGQVCRVDESGTASCAQTALYRLVLLACIRAGHE